MTDVLNRLLSKCRCGHSRAMHDARGCVYCGKSLKSFNPCSCQGFEEEVTA